MTAPYIACVKVGNRYTDDYVQKLQNGINRFAPGRVFICYCDKPVPNVLCRPVKDGLPGWWAKLSIFAAKEPLLYFDLDTVITDKLTRMFEWDGFGILRDCWSSGYGSGIMKLTGNEGHVWEKFRPGIMSMMRGDQDWLNLVLPGQKTFPPEWFPSYKADKCFAAPPEGAMAVSFHGIPKPHQITSGWVKDYWI